MNNWDQIYGDLKRRYWIIFLILTSVGYLFMSRSFTLGIILGGIIIIINFGFLQSSIIKAFQKNPGARGKKPLLMVKSFVRLFLLGGMIFFLLKYELADPVGLSIGLSIVFLSIVSMGISSAWRTGKRRIL